MLQGSDRRGRSMRAVLQGSPRRGHPGAFAREGLCCQDHAGGDMQGVPAMEGPCSRGDAEGIVLEGPHRGAYSGGAMPEGSY